MSSVRVRSGSSREGKIVIIVKGHQLHQENSQDHHASEAEGAARQRVQGLLDVILDGAKIASKKTEDWFVINRI